MKDEHFEKLFEEMLRESGTESLERLYDEYTKKYPDENEPIPDELDEMVRSLVDDVTEAPAAAAAESGSAKVAELSGRKKKGFFRRHYRIVALFAVVLLIGGGIGAMSVEAWRIKIFNLVIEVSDGKKVFGSQDADTSKQTVEISNGIKVPENIPKGYKFDIQYPSDTGDILVYTNGDSDIIFEQRKMDNTKFYESPQDDEEEIYINNNKGFILQNDEYIKIMWSDGNAIYKLSGSCDKQELIEMAESVF